MSRRGELIDSASSADSAASPASERAAGARRVLGGLRHPLLVSAVALAVLPFVAHAIGFTYGIATEIALFALAAAGLNLLLGYTGLLSFGHGLFFGFAAYAAALSQIHWFKGSLLAPLAFGVASTAVLGIAIGFLVLRRRGVYFSLLTLAFTALGFAIAFRWTNLTGGESGLRGITRAPVFGIDVDHPLAFYYFCAAIVFAVACVLWRIVNSPFGAVLVAIREREQRAGFVGYPVRRYRLAAFVISTAVMGVAGSLFTFLKLFAAADPVHPQFSGEILAMAIIGGTRSFMGPPLGAAFFILFREVLSSYTASWLFWFGLLFMAFILFSPTGLVGLWQRATAPFRRHAETLAAMASRVKPAPAAEVPPWLPHADPPLPGTVLLSANGVSKRFDDFVAVDQVRIELAHARLHALIGPNGAGKTTLFNLLSGMYPPDGGRLAYRGEPLGPLGPERFAALGIARSFQITNLFPSLTVRENLRLAVQARSPQRFALMRRKESLDAVNEQTRSLIRYLGLEGVEEAPVSSLSYGGQRLLEIGVALATRPRLLLLDEPLAGLAAAERERIVGMIRQLSRHMGVLLVEHDIDRVFGFAQRITAMANGVVLVEGDAAAVQADRQVQEVYLGSGRKIVTATRSAVQAGDVLLELDGVNTYYGKSHVLHDITLQVRANQVTALLGRNGAGKSSVIKTVMGLVAPASGTIRFAGASIAAQAPERIARAGIGLVPQGRRLFPGLTVAENLRLGGLARRRGAGVHWDAERIGAYFPRLRDKMNVKADLLSGGEQQMVAIARALSGNVRLLMLDEPFEGLAPAVVEEVFRSLDQLRSEIAIFIVEHDLDLVLALADHAYVLDRGRVSHQGPAEPLLTDLDFRRRVLWL
ncbi:MAG TPA: branched-chain amino acid ABC transporter ATP-binding protein/permease [Burkholderiaceae bacterium]|nr:branched-chain amino acid ABC transporter ATP-binding protein/permease [Burkholderiaceae bacterium]